MKYEQNPFTGSYHLVEQGEEYNFEQLMMDHQLSDDEPNIKFTAEAGDNEEIEAGLKVELLPHKSRRKITF